MSETTGDVVAWMDKLERLINDKNLTHPRVFYTWRETRELMEEALLGAGISATNATQTVETDGSPDA